MQRGSCCASVSMVTAWVWPELHRLSKCSLQRRGFAAVVRMRQDCRVMAGVFGQPIAQNLPGRVGRTVINNQDRQSQAGNPAPARPRARAGVVVGRGDGDRGFKDDGACFSCIPRRPSFRRIHDSVAKSPAMQLSKAQPPSRALCSAKTTDSTQFSPASHPATEVAASITNPGGGSRTRTGDKSQRILSPLRVEGNPREKAGADEPDAPRLRRVCGISGRFPNVGLRKSSLSKGVYRTVSDRPRPGVNRRAKKAITALLRDRKKV